MTVRPESDFAMPERDELYRSIGKFIYHFSHLEAQLRWIVAGELNIFNQPNKELVLSLIDYSGLCSAAKKMLLDMPKDKRPDDKTIKDVIERCRKMGYARNVIAHGEWSPDTGATHTDRNSLVSKLAHETPEETDRLTDQLETLISDVLDIYVFY